MLRKKLELITICLECSYSMMELVLQYQHWSGSIRVEQLPLTLKFYNNGYKGVGKSLLPGKRWSKC